MVLPASQPGSTCTRGHRVGPAVRDLGVAEKCWPAAGHTGALELRSTTSGLGCGVCVHWARCLANVDVRALRLGRGLRFLYFTL